MIVVVIVGMLCALAIPAFQKVRNFSQDKAIINNARLLGAAADQYFLQMGMSEVSFTDLVGPTQYVRSFRIVAEEKYPDTYWAGVTISITNVRGYRVITYVN